VGSKQYAVSSDQWAVNSGQWAKLIHVDLFFLGDLFKMSFSTNTQQPSTINHQPTTTT
jgi:hypothetical protein